MGKILFIIGCSGSFNPDLLKEKLVPVLSEAGLDIHHASVRSDGQTHFAIGTPTELENALAGVPGIPAGGVTQGDAGAVTLGTVNDNVLNVLDLLRTAVGEPPKSAKAKKEGGGKKEKAGQESPEDPSPAPVDPPQPADEGNAAAGTQPPQTEEPPPPSA